MREAISATVDGEAPALEVRVVERHLAGCADCRAFREAIGALDATMAVGAPHAPDLAAAVVARAARPRRGRVSQLELRIGVALMALGELGASAYLFISQHGYNAVDHASHESLSFTIAICVGLMLAAARPSYAAAYVPVIGVAVLLLGCTAAIDLREGRVAPLEEVPHVDLVIGLYLLYLLARKESGGGPVLPRSPAPFRPGGALTSGLRLITRVASLAPRPSLVVVRRVLATGMILGGALLIAAPADAHAVLEGSDPAPDVTLAHAPTAVTLRYDEAVTTLPTSLRVYGPDGARVDDGRVRHPGGVGKEVAVGLKGTAEGTYLVSWRVISADSHPVSGAFTFSVVKQTQAPAAADAGTSRPVAFALGTSRWVGYLGAALLIGGVAFLCTCWPRGWTVRRARALVLAGAAMVGVAALAALVLKGPYDAALGPAAIGRWSLITEVLGTTYGVGLVVRLASVLAAVALLVPVRRLPGRLRILGLTGAGLGLLVSFAVTGHAVAASPRALALASDMAHVAAMSVWLGGLGMLALVLLPRRELSEAGPAVARFSWIAAGCVLVLVGTGTYQAWRQVGAWAALPHTTYGRELLVKLGLVVVVLGAALVSRLWVRRHLRPPVVVHAATASMVRPEPVTLAPSDLRPLRRSVAVEAVGAVVVLVVTAMLVATEPARVAYHPTVAANLTLGPDTVQVSAVPTGDRSMSVHLYVFGKSLQPTDPAELTAAVSLPSHDVGPLDLSLQRVDVGHDVGVVSVPVTGDWTLSVTVRTTDIDEYTRQVTLPIR